MIGVDSLCTFHHSPGRRRSLTLRRGAGEGEGAFESEEEEEDDKVETAGSWRLLFKRGRRRNSRANWIKWSNNRVIRVCVELNIKHSLPLRRHRLGNRLRSDKGRNGKWGSILSSWEVPFIEIRPFTDNGVL